MQARMRAGDWVRFENGSLHARLTPVHVMDAAKTTGGICLSSLRDKRTSFGRFVFSYNGGVTGKNLRRYGREPEGFKALQVALRMMDRDAQVPFFGWRRRLLTQSDLIYTTDEKLPEPGIPVIELLSRTIHGNSCADLHAKKRNSAGRFRQVGFLDGCFHRKGIHVGFRENGRKLSNYIPDPNGTLWYVDIDPAPGEVVFSNSVREPLKQEQRMEFLRDHIFNIGYRMNEKCLLAYCEGYVQGFLDASELDDRMRIISRRLYAMLEPEMKKSELPERIIYTFE